jgi:septal ring factor EnvC (AmiA/AmiB activator)
VTPQHGADDHHERDVALAGQLGELRGMVVQLLQQMTSLIERVQSGETSTNSRMSHLEIGLTQLATEQKALTQQHIDDMRRLAEERAARAAARRQEAARQPAWWNTAGGVAAIITAVAALLALGGAIYAQVRP